MYLSINNIYEWVYTDWIQVHAVLLMNMILSVTILAGYFFQIQFVWTVFHKNYLIMLFLPILMMGEVRFREYIHFKKGKFWLWAIWPNSY